MRSTDLRSLRGEILTYFADAFASNSSSLASLTSCPRGSAGGGRPSSLQRRAPFGVMAVRPERPCDGELTQLVPHHRLGDEHRHVLAAVVHREGVPDHLGNDRRAPRPGLDDPLVAASVHLYYIRHQRVVDERSLLDRTWHLFSSSAPRVPRVAAEPECPHSTLASLARAPPLDSHQLLLFPRRRTMSLSDGFGLRVRPSFFPPGLVGWRPPLDLPSPPPSGWSTGFMATPRTLGRFPRHRLRPAFLQDTSSCSAFPTAPTVARHFASTSRISPEGKRKVARPASFARSCTPLPAERAIFAPAPAFNSTAWTTVPTGMLARGRAFPGRMSAPEPDCTRSPTERPAGARMYRLS